MSNRNLFSDQLEQGELVLVQDVPDLVSAVQIPDLGQESLPRLPITCASYGFWYGQAPHEERLAGEFREPGREPVGRPVRPQATLVSSSATRRR